MVVYIHPSSWKQCCPIKCKMCACEAISFTNATRALLSTVFALHLTYPEPNDPFHKPLIINGVEEKCISCLSAAKQQPVTEVIVGSYSCKFITRPASSPRILHYPLDLPRNLCCHSVFVRVPTITLIKCSGSRVAPVLLTPAAQEIHLALSLSSHTNTADCRPPIWRTGLEGLHVWSCFCWCSLGGSKLTEIVGIGDDGRQDKVAAGWTPSGGRGILGCLVTKSSFISVTILPQSIVLKLQVALGVQLLNYMSVWIKKIC